MNPVQCFRCCELLILSSHQIGLKMCTCAYDYNAINSYLLPSEFYLSPLYWTFQSGWVWVLLNLYFLCLHKLYWPFVLDCMIDFQCLSGDLYLLQHNVFTMPHGARRNFF